MRGYANDSGLMLEVKFEDSENWAKLKNSEPYERNREIPHDKQITQLEKVRDGWMANGPKKYFNASYRIGNYKHTADGYVWQDAKHHTMAGA